MNIEQHLRQLHKIEPNPDYARHSRARLMTATPQFPKVTFRSFAAGLLRSGSAMAAIGLLLFFAVGGSVWKLVFSPVTGWDSKTLLAEAQAIDTRIHLANLQYNDPGYERQRLISPNTNFNSIAIITAGPEGPDLPVSTPAEATTASSTDAIAEDSTNETAASSTDAAADDATNATSTPAEPEDTTINVEEALDILSH